MTTSAAVYHVVVGAGDRVLAVYGSALRHEADLKVVEVERQTLFAARVETVRGRRPKVGEDFPYRSNVLGRTLGDPVCCELCRGDPDRREGCSCWGCGLPSQMGN